MEKIWKRELVRSIGPDVHRQAHRRLLQLNSALRFDDVRVPPGNRLEKLSGDRVGQYSIRVNDQFRVCFRWSATGPEDVEFVDHH